mgnify:CR=1 FL=1
MIWRLGFEDLPFEAVVAWATSDERTYYSEAGDILCASFDGVEPVIEILSGLPPQAKKCAVCPHNAWGSRITPNGKRAKACSSFGTLGLITPGQTATAFTLRVPSTSLKALAAYEKSLNSRGYAYNNVLTKIDVQHKETHSLLTFRHLRILKDGELDAITKTELESRTKSRFDATEGYIH